MTTTDHDPQVLLDHQGMEVLHTDECWSLLAGAVVGRLAFVHDGEPQILPVNFAVPHGTHRILVRTFRGSILQEALMERPAAFEADAFDPAARTGWSVLARGLVRVADPERVAGVTLDAWADRIARDEWIELVPEEITGRRIAPHH